MSLLASVIVPVYNAEAAIRRCLDGILSQTVPIERYEVIVVDDGSQDNTAAAAVKYGIRVVSQQRSGPAAARNRGAQLAQSPILVFTDSDCVPTPDWLAALLGPFQDPEIVGTKGTYRTSQREITARFVQLEYEDKYRRMARSRYIDFIDTYSAAYRKDVFIQNGGFETAFTRPSVEDQEFSFRLARKGYLMAFAPEAVVYHHHDRHLAEYWERKYRTGYWKAFMLRWLPEKTFSDSHTPPSQRWQILLLFLAGLLAALAIPWPGLWPLALGCLALFYVTAAPFLARIMARDPQVFAAAPVLLLCRAAALGTGLLAGFVFPPSTQPRSSAGLSLPARVSKRALDIVGALVGLVLSVPLIVIAAIAIKLDSPGPVFFLQERAGENGKPFRVIKLRTMVEGAQQQVQEVLAANPLKGPVYKIPDDPRVTGVGRFLRRWSLDELPQFWNVLKGDMSLVGPRPEETWVVAQYNDHQRQRLAVKPGLTGPMQVAGRGQLDMDARLRLELDYIQNVSIWTDVSILLRTVPAILSGKGAF